MTLDFKIREFNCQLKQQGLLRKRTAPSCNDSVIHFDSNDYLSLSKDKRVACAYQDGYKYYPSGSGASMLLSGYHANHQALENAFAKILAVDDCVLFSSGYAANLAVSALISKINAHCVIDKKIHASIYDGLALSKTGFTRFSHNNMFDLKQKLMASSTETVCITEGIFSMSGQIAPLSIIADLCSQYKAGLVVDEAHAFGIIGEHGKGATAHYGLSQQEVPLRIIPFGKTLASQGAIVAGKQEWIDALLQAGRSVIYSTAISPALSYGLLKTLDIVIDADDRRLKLKQLVTCFKHYAKDSPLDWTDSHTPIQQLQLGCPHKALYYADELNKEGISCSAIRAPTVNIQSTGLRIILNFDHQSQCIQHLFNILHKIYEHSSH